MNAPKTPPLALEIQALTVGYSRVPVLHDVDFSVVEGDILGIIGPNGSGKSTLFKTILGLMKPWHGQTRIFGQTGNTRPHTVGYMPQMELVNWEFPVNVIDVVMMGRYSSLGLFRLPSKKDYRAALESLDRVGMAEHRERLIGELSGGQRRRVLLARALSSSPKLLLLDEPMAGLDATAQHQLIDIIHKVRDDGATVVISTHDLSCVSTACDCACCLKGTVVAIGTPAEVLTEKILSETFGIHLLTVHQDTKAYAYQHHLDISSEGQNAVEGH